MKIPLYVHWASVAVLLVALPSYAFAYESASSTVREAVAPVGMVSAGAGELASFVLSAVALVVAGIALSRTRRYPHQGRLDF